MNPDTPRTNAFAQSVCKDGIDWHHSATLMAGHARALELELNHIYAVASGEDQVCDSDTDGLAHIASYILSKRVTRRANMDSTEPKRSE